MAEGEYRRLTCGACFSEFTQSGRGRNAKTCAGCRTKRSTPGARPGEPSALPAKEPAATHCKRCGQVIEKPRRGKIYCTRLCALRERDGTVLTRAEYREQCRANARWAFVCACCGRQSLRSISATNRQRGYDNRFCSMACRTALSERVNREIAFLHRLGREAKEAARQAARPRAHVLGVRYIPPVRTCPHCGLQWSAIRRVGVMRHCQSPECQEAWRKERRRARGNKSHIDRARKHGRRYGYWNVLRVFERDKWRCQLCGMKTPKSLRGTTDPRAPEIDHIVPIAAGGDHVIENCQCACRRCNAAKSARPAGQMWLAGFADLC